MDKQLLLIFALIFLIMMSAYFSSTETASGNDRAQQVLNILKQYD